jgi:hypothetical protein
MARPYNRKRGLRKKLRVAANPEQNGRVKDFAETLGIGFIGVRDESCAGFGEVLDLLIGGTPGMTIEDELDAFERQLE